MSHSVILPPVHDTSPPPFDDDADENDIDSTIPNDEYLSSTTPDVLNNSNDEWKSVDDNNDTDIAQIQDETTVINDENILPSVNLTTEEDIPIEVNLTNDENIMTSFNLVNEENIFTDANPTNEEDIITSFNLKNDEINITNVNSTNEENTSTDFNPINDENIITSFNFINEDNVLTDVNPTDEENIFTDVISTNEGNILTNAFPTDEENNNNNDDDGWANFASFEDKIEQNSEILPVTTSTVTEENNESDWADFESNTVVSSEQPIQSINNEQSKQDDNNNNNNDDDDDFGDFSEVQVAPTPQPSSLPTNTLSTEQIESLISTCFPTESTPSSTNTDCFMSAELPSFTTYKDPMKQISCLESSLSLWDVLSNLSNDPVGIKFQWRKSNTERLFHQALGVNERFRPKNVPLQPEILQPEKLKSTQSNNNELENTENENKLSNESIRPHFDWKQSGLQNPLADNDSSSLSSNTSKNETNGFDANKTLDLDFYVPPIKNSNEEEQTTSLSSTQSNDSPIIPQPQKQSIPIKTMDLYPGSTTTLNDDAKRIIDNLPNLSFMSAKALMFPIRFNSNTNDESPTLY